MGQSWQGPSHHIPVLEIPSSGHPFLIFPSPPTHATQCPTAATCLKCKTGNADTW